MFTKDQQDRAIQAAHFQQAVARGIEQIYAAYPTLMRCDANAKLIVEYVRDFLGDDVAPDLDTFKNLMGLNPDLMSTLVHRAVEVTRQQLIEDILSLLASKDGGRDGKYDQFNLRSEKQRMASWSLDALRARLQEIRTRQQMSTRSVADLKQIVRDGRPETGYPALPKQVWTGSGHTLVDRAFFKSLDPFELKKYNRLYGTEQVNARIQQG